MENAARRYVLTPAYALRGWKLLPYGVQRTDGTSCEFMTKHDYALLLDCDGQTDIPYDGLPERDRARYYSWEQGKIIRRCGEGERLLPVQRYRFYENRYKESVQWSVTGKCNYRCRHCFMSAPHAATGEPSWDELMTMLDSFAHCGIRGVGLTGGEPLIRADFLKLVDEIVKRDMLITAIYTNGLLVTDAFLDELEKRQIRTTFQFSFDGVGHHNWMRGVPGAEKAVIGAFKRCRDRGIRTSASMAMCRESAPSIRETVKLLADLGCSSLKINNATPQGEWLGEPEHYLTLRETYQTYLDYIPAYFEDGAPLSLMLEGFFHYSRERQREKAVNEKDVDEGAFGQTLMCSIVRSSMYVSPRGNVLPCMSLVGTPIEAQFPNLLETPLEKILSESSHYMNVVDLRVGDYMEHNPDCRACEYREACCGGCRAVALNACPEDYLSRDMHACEYFRGGWKAKKDALMKELGFENGRRKASDTQE